MNINWHSMAKLYFFPQLSLKRHRNTEKFSTLPAKGKLEGSFLFFFFFFEAQPVKLPTLCNLLFNYSS